MDIKQAKRKSFDVEYVVVSEENIQDAAEWSKGTVGGEGAEQFVKISDKNAISVRQTKAFIGDYIVKMEGTTSFKMFGEKAFLKTFEPMNTDPNETPFDEVVKHAEPRHVARSAKSGKFVSEEEAKANPDTTVTETLFSHKEE